MAELVAKNSKAEHPKGGFECDICSVKFQKVLIFPESKSCSFLARYAIDAHYKNPPTNVENGLPQSDRHSQVRGQAMDVSLLW